LAPCVAASHRSWRQVRSTPDQYTVAGVGRLQSYALLNRFDVFFANADAPCSAQVPGGLSGQILNHDAAEYGELGFNVVEDTVIGQIEAVCDLLARPVYMLLVDIRERLAVTYQNPFVMPTHCRCPPGCAGTSDLAMLRRVSSSLRHIAILLCLLSASAIVC
jgi:hypothetical protein